jgi:hypothetical protein
MRMDGCIIGKCVKGQTLGCWPSAELGGRAIATHVVDQKSRLVVRHPLFFFFYTNCMGFFFLSSWGGTFCVSVVPVPGANYRCRAHVAMYVHFPLTASAVCAAFIYYFAPNQRNRNITHTGRKKFTLDWLFPPLFRQLGHFSHYTPTLYIYIFLI